MASKAADKMVKSARSVKKTMVLTQRMLWEKYNKPGRNLFQALGAFENNGVGQRVQPLVWKQKGFKKCFFTVTEFKPRFTVKGLHGRAKGILTWKGVIRNDGKDQQIPKALKEKWRVLDPDNEA